MSLVLACCWTIARSAFVCLAVWPIITCIERWLRSVSDLRRPMIVIIVLLPALFPELLVGYTFRSAALRTPWFAEVLCTTLLLVRIVPLGVVTLLCSPPALIDSSAIYCRWISLRHAPHSVREWNLLLSCYWHGPIRRFLPALSVMALVSFQEFELTALLQTTGWTDWFIAAQRVGLDRQQMLASIIWPVGLQIPLLIGVWIFGISDRSGKVMRSADSVVVPSMASSRFSLIYLIVAILYGCLIPLSVLSSNATEGMFQLIMHSTRWIGLAREIGVASAVSLFAGVTTWLIGGIGWDRLNSSRVMSFCGLWLLIPGLQGSLLLSLAMMELFQRTSLNLIYDTTIPWILTLIIWLVPRVVLMQSWLLNFTRMEEIHLAEMMLRQSNLSTVNDPHHSNQIFLHSDPSRPVVYQARRILFRLRDQPKILAIGLLCYWAYLDLSSAFLLAPIGMPSGLVRIYNFMHFGRSTTLSAESLVFFGTPLMAILLVSAVMNWISRRRRNHHPNHVA